MTAHTPKEIDITGRIGPLFFTDVNVPAECPMYSYERPAYMLWNAVAQGMVNSGMTEAKAIKWLQSKDARHALDGELGTALVKLGEQFGASIKP